ncbi:MAG TPA: hypothetical protein VMZ91_01845, partial [Candidatus Paceibacterota bacterium]|nr:hypothetical protein [Candidatus Paceibacterota bacterium]
EQAPTYLDNFANQLSNLLNNASLEITDTEGIIKANIKKRVEVLKGQSRSIQLLINDIKKAKTPAPAPAPAFESQLEGDIEEIVL